MNTLSIIAQLSGLAVIADIVLWLRREQRHGRLFVILSFVISHSAFAAPSISFEWGASPDATNIILEWRPNNYRLYWGPGSGNYTNFSDLGNVTNTVFTNLTVGTRQYFVVTARNVAGLESDPSNELNFLVPKKPRPPVEFRIVQSLQSAATPLGPWREIGTLASLLPAETNAQFFRAVLSVSPPALP